MAKKKEQTESKLSIKTVVLQEMVSRAIKGAGQNKLIAITSLMAIQLKDKQLKLITTDASNTLYVMQNDVEGEDFYCTVRVEQFSQLIAKTTSENVTLTLEGSVLVVKGNGTYKIELPLDENGDIIQYPDPASELAVEGEMIDINLSTIKTILATNKAALAVTMEEPVYTCYYMGDTVVTTDKSKICGLNVKMFDDPILLFPETVDLLDVMTEEKISAYVKDDIIEFISKDCIVYAHIADGIEDFAINEINTLLGEEFESSCKVARNDLLSLLDRINLFVGTYDNRAITLTFTEQGIEVSSKQSNGVELIPYLESKNFKPYTCDLDIKMLVQQIKANAADGLNIQYGNEVSLKFVDGNVTQILALLMDDSVAE